MATIKKSQTAQEREWQVDSAINTLHRYNELMKDGGLMRDVHKKAKAQLDMVTAKLGSKIAKKASPKKTSIKKVSSTKKKK